MRDYTADELGRKLFESVRQMQSGQIGRSTLVTPNHVAEARLRTGLSQTQFAQALNISARTLQEWEQGRRQPSGAAQALINIAFKHPQVIVDELSQR